MTQKQKDPLRFLYAFFFIWFVVAACLYVYDWRAHGAAAAEKSDVVRLVELIEKHKDTVVDGSILTIVLRDTLREFDPVDSIVIHNGKQVMLTIQGHLRLEGRACWSVFSDLGLSGEPSLAAAKCGTIEINLERLPKKLVQRWYDERITEALARLSRPT